MASVHLEHLTKVYDGGVPAVQGLDLEIADGELLVLVGPSGCGKTTALRLIAGLETATGGRVRIGSRDVTDLAPRDRDIAMVFQSYALYPHMTVAENLAFGLRMRKVPKAEVEERVARVASQLGLGELLARRPGALSGGQRQRVALGRAIVREPAVFLFDEPLSNLDAKLRVKTRAELVALHRSLGTTMVYVTHDQTEAMTMGQRVAVLDRGELQQVAAPLDLYDRPANLMVAGFIGSPPMNFFPGNLAPVENGVRFRGASLTIPVAPLDAPSAEAVLGVRPEHILLVGVKPDRVGSPDALATVQVVEALGPETLVHCRTDQGEEVTLRTGERPEVRPEQLVGLRIDRAHLHLFDADTGRRISQPPAVGERWWVG